MASIKGIMDEIQAWGAANPGQNPFDFVRKQKIAGVQALTGRPLLIYATDFFNPKLPPNLSGLLSINVNDKDFFAEITDGIGAREVDLLIHSPGGSAEATESIVTHLRSRFENIRVIVPGMAKSAATMLSMSADELLMDELSELGPIDPQIGINGRFSPAGAILKQFEKAQEELKNDPAKIGAWLPLLQQYGPSILVECDNHFELGKRLVKSWLIQHMFSAHPSAEKIADEIAEWLAEDSHHLSHARRIGIDELERKGLKVTDLRSTPPLREAVRQLHLAILETFRGTGTYKLFENSEGVSLGHGIAVTAIAPTPPTP